jgi:hypothetical protein
VPLPRAARHHLRSQGKVIAENLPGYTVSIYSPHPDSLRESLTRLNAIIPYSQDDIETAVRRFRRAPNRPAVVLADATFQEVSVLEEHRTEFPQLIIQSTPKRWYPDGPAVASLVGYTGEISELELATPKYEAYKAGMRVGKRGLEQQYEGYLRGREGYRFVEVDARGRVVREAARAPTSSRSRAPTCRPTSTSTCRSSSSTCSPTPSSAPPSPSTRGPAACSPYTRRRRTTPTGSPAASPRRTGIRSTPTRGARCTTRRSRGGTRRRRPSSSPPRSSACSRTSCASTRACRRGARAATTSAATGSAGTRRGTAT